MNKFYYIVIGAIVGFFLSYSLLTTEKPVDQVDLSDDLSLSIHKWEQLVRYLEHRYVDSLHFGGITDEAISNALKTLDPHSSYISGLEKGEYNEQLEGIYLGVGIETLYFEGRLFVKQVYEGSPAMKSGLQVGDEILALDGIQVDTTRALQKLHTKLGRYSGGVREFEIRGKDGSKKIVQIERGWVHVPSIYSHVVEDDIGYIRLFRFSRKTYSDFMSALSELHDQGVDHLVIDVRGNPGGYLRQVIDILCQLYEEKDKVIVYTEGENAKRVEYKTTGKVFYPMERIVVLTNRTSASGSEVLAATIQDTDRGIVIGEPSFGKGLVQEGFEMIDGSEIRLTTSRYYTPSGRSIQKDYSSEAFRQNELDASGTFQSKAGRELEGHCGVIPDLYVKDTSVSKFLESEILSCCFANGVFDAHDLETKWTEISQCLEELTEEEFEKRHLVNALHKVSSPQEALETSLHTDPVFLEALDVIGTDRYEAILLDKTVVN